MLPVRVIGGLLALIVAMFPLTSRAQETNETPPPFANAAPAETAAPSYARPAAPGEDRIEGTITAFDGRYDLHVRDDHGYVDSVRMRQGTIINPTGITLLPGMRVTVYGTNGGSVLLANEIDTPYQSYGAYPYPYAYPYAYPWVGYPWGLSFGFRFGGPYWGGYHWR